MGSNIDSKVTARLLQRAASKMSSGECGLSEDESLAIVKMICPGKLYIAELCSRLNCTQRTLERWANDGLIPPLRKDKGGKKYLFEWEIEIWENKR